MKSRLPWNLVLGPSLQGFHRRVPNRIKRNCYIYIWNNNNLNAIARRGWIEEPSSVFIGAKLGLHYYEIGVALGENLGEIRGKSKG